MKRRTKNTMRRLAVGSWWATDIDLTELHAYFGWGTYGARAHDGWVLR